MLDVLVGALWLQVATPALDPRVAKLGEIKARMAQVLNNLPNYTCTQTIERSRRPAKSRRFQLIDTIRLEVALVSGKEMFAWPGAGKFDDRELRDIVGGGTLGNGNFALHARGVFLGRSARFEFDSELAGGSRSMLRYRYVVPRLLSGYKIRVNEAEGITGYRGTIDVDAETLDLARLVVTADDIPSHLPLQSASDEMRYARTRIGEHDFLLPQSSELTMISLDGTESRNRVHFADCRQYSGESVITFADPDAVPDPAAPPPVATVDVELPEGLSLEAALEESIKFEKAAIGDPVSARLMRDAKLKGRTIVPKGAVVRGRLMGSDKVMARTEVRRLTLEILNLEFPGARAQLHVELEDFGPIIGAGARTGFDKKGIIYISGTRTELPKGTRFTWRTRPPQGKEQDR